MFTFSKQHWFTLSLVILIVLPNIALIAIGEDSIAISKIKSVVYLAFSIAYIIFPLVLIKPKTYALLSLFITPLIIFELFNVFNFKAPSSEEMVATIFYTNYHETAEFAASNISYLLLLLVLFAVQIYLFLKLKKDFYLHKKLRILLFVYTISVFGVLFIRDYMFAIKHNDTNSFTKNLLIANDQYVSKLYKVFPISFYYNIKGVITGIKKINVYNETIKDFKYGAVKKDTLNVPEIYILVIGETARKHNFQLLGYHRNTTPNLSKLDNLSYFTDVKSAANLTSLSMPFIVTRATPNTNHISVEEPAILNVFKEAGFKTYWLTNQPTGISGITGFYSRLADSYKSIAVSVDVAKFDELLLPELDLILKDTSINKKFIVIHTLGSHFRYNFRYPESFEKFTPTVNKTLSLNANNISLKKEFVNSYDNSILYTDYILSEIIKHLEKTKSISYMYYISDHGENLYDDNREYLMHGLINPTKYEIEVPLVIWNSDAYRNNYYNKIEALKKYKNNRISTVNTFHTLLDMANITYKDENLTKSFANKQFDSLQTRYLLQTNKKILKLDK